MAHTFRFSLAAVAAVFGFLVFFGVAGAVDVTLIVDDASAPSGEEAAVDTALAGAGHTVTRLEAVVFASDGLDPATAPVLVIDRTGSTFPPTYTSPEFATELKAYLTGGGGLVLFGTAPELLDIAGVTGNAFGVRAIGENRPVELDISAVDHPITAAYTTSTDLLLNTGHVTGATFDRVPDGASVRILGDAESQYRYSCCQYRDRNYGRSLGVLHYDAGTIVTLASARFGASAPTPALTTLASDMVAYAAAPEHGGLRISFTQSGAAHVDAPFDLTAVVTATGSLTVPGVTTTLTPPAGTTIVGGTVDGAPAGALLTHVLGDMAPGSSHTVVWQVTHGSHQYASFNASAASTVNRIDPVAATANVGVHVTNAASATIAVLDTGSTATVTRDTVTALGWTATLVTPDDVADGLVTTALYRALVVPYYASSFPADLTAPTFLSGFEAYVAAGGRAVLLGAAADLLDRAGITTNAVTVKGVGGVRAEMRLDDRSHPITTGLVSKLVLNTGGLTGSVWVGPDPGTAVARLGTAQYYWKYSCCSYRTDEAGTGLFVLPHGAGKAYGMGSGVFDRNAPTDSLYTLFMRVLDDAEVGPAAHLVSTLDAQSTAVLSAPHDVTLTVTGGGGGSADEVSTVLTLPPQATVLDAAIDGVPVATPAARVDIGAVASGLTKTVTWTLRLDALGINPFTATVTSESPGVPTSLGVDQTAVHRAGALVPVVGILDTGVAQVQATRAELDALGFTTVIVAPLEIDYQTVDPADVPTLVVPYYSSTLPLALRQPSFSTGFKAYVAGGGNSLLMGTAAELLDATGITSDAVSIGQVGQHENALRVTNTGHAITEGFGSSHVLNTNLYNGARIVSVDAWRGVHVLGEAWYKYRSGCCNYYPREAGNGLFVLPHGNGKAVGLATGIFGQGAPTDDLRTLVSRIVDALAVDDLAHLEVGLDTGDPSEQNLLTTVTATVKGVGGGAAPDAAATLGLPPGASIVAGAVDGVDQALVLPTYALGTIASGDSRVVTWTLRLASLGPNAFTVTASSSSPRILDTVATSTKFNHIPGAIDARVALVDAGDGRAAAFRADLERMGFDVTLVAPFDIDNGRVVPSATPRLVVYDYRSGLPSQFTQPSFTRGFREYMEAGGDVLLMGTAGDILDASGITSGRVTNRQVGDDDNELRITDNDHIALAGLGGTLTFHKGHRYGSTLASFDDSIGMRTLGDSRYLSRSGCCNYYLREAGTGLFVVPFGHGKATVLGSGDLSGGPATAALDNVVMRLVDGLAADELAALKVSSPTHAAGSIGDTVRLSMRIDAHGGGIAPDVAAVIGLPSGATVVAGYVDGDLQDLVLPRYELGGITSGETRTVAWDVTLPRLGVHAFTLHASSLSSRVPDVVTRTSAALHRDAALDVPVTVVQTGDAESAAVAAKLADLGYEVLTTTPTGLAAGLDRLEHPVLVVTSVHRLSNALRTPDVREGLRAYLESGGHAVFLAASAEMLDEAGITPGTFIYRRVSDQDAFVRVFDKNHPITEGIATKPKLGHGNVDGSVVQSTPPGEFAPRWLGMAAYQYRSGCCRYYDTESGNGLGTLEVGGGRVAFSSTLLFSRNGPTVAADDLLMRLVDYQAVYTAAPLTRADLAGTSGDPGWFRSDVTVTLTATPGVDGDAVASTFYRTNDAAFAPYTAPFTVAGEGTHTVTFYSTDVNGDVEAAKRATLHIDVTPPVTRISAGAPNVPGNPDLVVGPATLLTVSGADAGSGIGLVTVRVDAEPEGVYEGPFSLARFGAGAHAVSAQTTDKAGNAGTVANVDVVLDLTPPRTTLSFGVPGATRLGDDVTGTRFTRFILNGVDGEAGNRDSFYRVDDGAARRYEGPFRLDRADGAYTLEYWSVDRVGNPEAPRRVTVELVSSGGDAVASFIGPHYFDVVRDVTFMAPHTRIAFVAGDGATTYYRLDGGPLTVYEEPFLVPVTRQDVRVSYSIESGAGPGAERDFYVYVDDAAPTATARLTGAVDVDGTAVLGRAGTVAFDSTDIGVGGTTVRYRVDGGPWRDFDVPFGLGDLSGAHIVEYQATDLVGNRGVVERLDVVVDTVAPVASVACPADPGCAVVDGVVYVAPDGRLLVQATDDVSGVADRRVSFDGGASWLTLADGTTTVPGGPGYHTMRFSATDRVGNVAIAADALVFVDAAAPTAAWVLPPTGVLTEAGPIVSAADPLRLTGLDPVADGGASGVAALAYTVASGAWTAYADGVAIANDGTRVVGYRATDAVGNVGAAGDVTVHTDATAPVTGLAIGPRQAPGTPLFVSPATTFTFTSVDPVVAGVASGVAAAYVAVDAAEASTVPGTFTLAGHADGPRSVTHFAADAVANAEAPQTQAVYLDATPPDLVVTGVAALMAPADLVTALATDPAPGGAASGVARIEASVDGGPWFDATAPFSVSDRDGTHELRVRALDAVGNAAPTQTFTIAIDGTSPTAALTSPVRASAFAGALVVGGDADGDGFPLIAEETFGSDPLDPLSVPGTEDIAPPLADWSATGDLAWSDTPGAREARGPAGTAALATDVPLRAAFAGVSARVIVDAPTSSVTFTVATRLGDHVADVPVQPDRLGLVTAGPSAFDPPVPAGAAATRVTLSVDAAPDAFADGVGVHVRDIAVHAFATGDVTTENVVDTVAALVLDTLAKVPPAPDLPDVCVEDTCAEPPEPPVDRIATVGEMLGEAAAAVFDLAAQAVPDEIDGSDTGLLAQLEAAVATTRAALDDALAGALQPVPPVEAPQPPAAPNAPTVPPVPDADVLVAIGDVDVTAAPVDFVVGGVSAGVASATVSVDGTAIGSATEAPFTVRWAAGDAVAGPHMLTVTVTDGVGHTETRAFQALAFPSSETGAFATLAFAVATHDAVYAQAEVAANDAVLQAEAEVAAAPDRVASAEADAAAAAENAENDARGSFPLTIETFDPTGFRVRDDDLDGVPAVWGRSVTVTVQEDGSFDVTTGAFAPTGHGDPDDADAARRAPGDWPVVVTVLDPSGVRVRDDDLDGSPRVWARDATVAVAEDGSTSTTASAYRDTGFGDQDDADGDVGAVTAPEAPSVDPPTLPDAPDVPPVEAPETPPPPGPDDVPDAPDVPDLEEAPTPPDPPEAPVGPGDLEGLPEPPEPPVGPDDLGDLPTPPDPPV